MTVGRKIPRAAFVAAWNDSTLTTDDIAAMFGVHRSSVSLMGRARGLPPRKLGAKQQVDREAFTRLWLAGVSTAQIAKGMDMARNYPGVLARRFGLQPRKQGMRGTISMADFHAAQLRNAMAASARDEQAALWNAEMCDGRHDPNRTTRRAA